MRAIGQMLAAVGMLACGVGTAAGQGESPYMRVVDPDARTVRLDIAVRALAPQDHDGPMVNLVGAIHIGDGTFYDEVQALLDVHDVVLYEGVGGPRDAAAALGGEAEAAAVTERRVRFLAVMAEDVRRREGEHPGSAAALRDAVDGPLALLVAESSVDAWGRPFAIEAGEDGFEVVSLGADGRAGGEGTNGDIRASELSVRPRAVPNAGQAAGLQRDLAEALGLVFQMDGIDYSQPHWRNSDLSVGEIQEALGGAPAEDWNGGAAGERGELDPDAPDQLKAADMLFKTLAGESVLAKVSGFLLKALGSNPSGRAMVKIMLADMLTHAEDLLAMQPGGLAELMKVIVEDRNAAVVSDLRGVIEEPGVESVAIFYGAGHFGDLEARICEELGYRHESTFWVPAMTVDISEAGLSPQQVKLFRRMMGDMIEAQMKAAGGRD